MNNSIYHEHYLRERNDSWYVAFMKTSDCSVSCYYENRHFGNFETFGLEFESIDKSPRELACCDKVYEPGSGIMTPLPGFIWKAHDEFNRLTKVKNSEHTPVFYLVHWLLVKSKNAKMQFGFEDDIGSLLEIINEVLNKDSSELNDHYNFVVKKIDEMYVDDEDRPIEDFDMFLRPLIVDVIHQFVLNQLNETKEN